MGSEVVGGRTQKEGKQAGERSQGLTSQRLSKPGDAWMWDWLLMSLGCSAEVESSGPGLDHETRMHGIPVQVWTSIPC